MDHRNYAKYLWSIWDITVDLLGMYVGLFGEHPARRLIVSYIPCSAGVAAQHKYPRILQVNKLHSHIRCFKNINPFFFHWNMSGVWGEMKRYNWWKITISCNHQTLTLTVPMYSLTLDSGKLLITFLLVSFSQKIQEQTELTIICLLQGRPLHLCWLLIILVKIP